MCLRERVGQGLELGDLADVSGPGQRPLDKKKGTVGPDRTDGIDLVLTRPLRAERAARGNRRRRHAPTLASPDMLFVTASLADAHRADGTRRPSVPVGYGDVRWTSTWAKTLPLCEANCVS